MKNQFIILAGIVVLFVFACKSETETEKETRTKIRKDSLSAENPIHEISKPYARYWWFSSEIKKEDIRYNLDYLKENGFGGVELAWVYPLHSKQEGADTVQYDKQKWLSPEWREIVSYAMNYADSIGLACDLTMGTLWPFGDSYVSYEQAAQTYGKDKRQRISRSWEFPKKGYVIDHLNPKDYMPYFNRLLDSFPHPRTQMKHAYFVDSWEVYTEKIWTDGFAEDFKEKYGYDIRDYMDDIYSEKNKNRLYDYMSLVSEKVLAFYHNFDAVLNENDIFSRAQCSGAPCDIISAYAKIDIPEGEAMLYEPEFNSIPASAAALSGKKVVSAETFTCIYGWPGHYLREEQTADLKLLADALFANGINHIIWHGKAHNRAASDSVNFYATVHLGKDGNLHPELKAFNKYMEKVSEKMKKGKTYSDIAVYLPYEDAVIKGYMPEEIQFKWAWGHYEMRYVYFPEETRPYHPLWINREFLQKAKFENGKLKVNDNSFSMLYINSEFLDKESIRRVYELAEAGLPICMKQIPKIAGTQITEADKQSLQKLKKHPNISSEFNPVNEALVSGAENLRFWARESDEAMYLFFANPNAADLKFPLEYGQAFTQDSLTVEVGINYKGKSYKVSLRFEPYQSLMYKVERGKIEKIDIGFEPEIPQVKKRPAGFKAPWKVH